MSPKVWKNTIGADARNLDEGKPNQLSYLDDDGNDVNGKEAHEQKKCSCIELINEFSFEWVRDVE